MRELTDMELDAVSGGFAVALGGNNATAIQARVRQSNFAVQVGVNDDSPGGLNVNAAHQSNSSSIGSGGGGGDNHPGPGGPMGPH